MPIIEPTPVDAAPEVPDRANRATFPQRMFAAFTYLFGAFRTGMTNLATNAYNNATEAYNAALAAASAAGAAGNSANSAANAAAASANSAASALAAPGTSATSTTHLTIGTGSKTLTIQTGKSFTVGQSVVIADTAAPAASWMWGQITAHDSGAGSLTVNAIAFSGAGTNAAWTIGLSSNPSVEKSSIIRIGRTSNTMLVAGDSGKLIDATSGSWTQTFADPDSLGDGWFVYHRNSGSGIITLSGLGEVLLQNEIALIQCDGAALRIIAHDKPTIYSTESFIPITANREYVLGGTNYYLTALPSGSTVRISKPTSTTSRSITIQSDEGGSDRWTYKTTATSTATELFTLQGTGTKRPYLPEGGALTPPSYSLSTTYAPIDLVLYAPGYCYFVRSYEGVNSNAVVVNRATGNISNEVLSVGGLGTCAIYNAESAGKLVCFYSGLNDSDDTFLKITSQTMSNIADIELRSDANLYGSWGERYNTAQLSDTLYITVYSGTDIRAVSVNLTNNTATSGAAASFGISYPNVVALDATRFLVAGVNTNGGVVNFRVGTVSGTSISVGTNYASAEAVNTSNGAVIIKLATDKYLYICYNSSTPTTLHIYGLTISGSVVTVSTQLAIPSFGTPPTFFTTDDGYLNKQWGNSSLTNAVVIDSDRVLLRKQNATIGAMVVKFSGGVLTAGSVFSDSSILGFTKDMATGSNIYLVTASTWQKLTITDTTIAADYSVGTGGQISCVFAEGLTNREFRGADNVWYSFGGGVMGAINRPISSTIGLQLSTSTSFVRRNITI